MAESVTPQNSDTGRAPGTRRDTARLRSGRESQRDTGRIQADSAANFRVAVFAPRLDLDGITLYTRTLLRALRERHDTVMLVSPGGALADSLDDAWDARFEMDDAEHLGFFGWRRLKEALTEFEPDVLHSVCPDANVAAVRAADHFQIPLAVSVHGIKPNELPQPQDRKYDAYVACDQSVRERLLNDCRLDRDRTTLISDCAFPERNPDDRRILDPRKRQVVGWVSPLTEGCGYRCFIEAAIKVQARGVDSMFSILGTGPYGAEVRDEVEARGMLPRIVVVQGLYDYARIWDPYDIAIVDTRQRASLLMVLNAMANGRPVIATEGGAVFDLIQDGVDGLIVPRDDPDALAERILMLVQNPAERLRMATAAFEKVEQHYDPGDMAYALNAVYAAMVTDEALPKTFDSRTMKRSARASSS
ncbi:MAG: glycosyltransferase family 4 protein [Planctomycetes bacterium]|nr:glycosyltransferase family 4 protein [Planctomycetota bacterium]